MKHSLLLLATTAVIALSSSSFAEEKKAEPAEKKKDYVIVEVNGDKVKHSEIEKLWQGHFPAGAAPEFDTFDERIKDNLVRGVVSERIIYKEALNKGFDKKDEVKERLDAIKKQLVLQAFMDEQTKDAVTEEKIKAAYDAKVKEYDGKEEVKARHILVSSEEVAKDLVKQLKEGGNFEALAKEKSEDKGSGAAGGDLGYFTQDKMVPEFGKAAYALKKGEISEPVKSDFGWHVIKLEDRRKVTVPAFDQLKDSVRQELSDKAVTAYVEKLLEKANVKYFDAEGKEKPFNVKPPVPAVGADPKKP